MPIRGQKQECSPRNCYKENSLKIILYYAFGTFRPVASVVLQAGLYIFGYSQYTRVGTLIVATIYLQMIQNRYMFRSFTVLQRSHQHCVQPVASDVEVVGYL